MQRCLIKTSQTKVWETVLVNRAFASTECLTYQIYECLTIFSVNEHIHQHSIQSTECWQNPTQHFTKYIFAGKG